VVDRRFDTHGWRRDQGDLGRGLHFYQDPAYHLGYRAELESNGGMNKLLNTEAITSEDLHRQTTTPGEHRALGVIGSLRGHWPEYLMEAGELTFYMFFTCIFATVLQDPVSPVRQLIASPILRRALMGLAVGATVIAIVLTPWGKQSGGHFNPAMTFAFYRLGKVEFWDVLFYSAAQFPGAILGVCIAKYLIRGATRYEAVRYAVTAPGVYGFTAAFLGELTISCVLMATVLFVSNHSVLARYTPYFVGALYAAFITFETPLSGMSMNPARTFGSAFHAGYWNGLWIYFVAPTLGMLIAGEVFLRIRGGVPPLCAKLHHANNKRCIFCHGDGTTRLPGLSGRG
jgi:aquaporin Z